MARHIQLILGQSDPRPTYCRSLAELYTAAAVDAGHEVRRVDLATFSLPPPIDAFEVALPDIDAARDDLLWADHVVCVLPLQRGAVPGVFSNFMQQLLRPGTGLATARDNRCGRLAGRSVRLFVTTEMRVHTYRWHHGAVDGLRAFERGVLTVNGLGPIRECVIGNIASPWPSARLRWLARAVALGGEAR